jgi:two-component system sensor histidine kinase DegS
MSSSQKNKFDVKALDQVLTKMIDTVTDSKNQIFEISERSRNDYDAVLQELENVKARTADVIEKNDRLERQARLSRSRLAEVSKHFQDYGEEAIRQAYEHANRIQVELSVVRETERQLREKRDDLERRLTGLQETVEKAETLAGQVSVVFNYLNGDLRQIGEMIEDARETQAFGLKIIEAQEEERRRLSREIHDGPAQTLAHVLLGSELVERIHKEKGAEAAHDEFNHLRQMIKQALYDVRRIIYDLRPMTLDDLGLVPTLKKYLRRIEEQEKVLISFREFGESGRLPAKMEAALFRLVQEAVQNACAHAEAGEIQVKLDFRQNAVILVIKDDGKGFDPEEKKDGSFGLIGMKERVDLLEGDISIHSRSGYGTVISIQIPVHNQGEAK